MDANVRSEFELYEPMRGWLHSYLCDKYRGFEIITLDCHSERLDRVLSRYGIVCEMAIGIDIQIDVLGIARRGDEFKLFFIEAKKTHLNLHDLGQLWAYCKLIDPAEAFLFSSLGIGSLAKILSTFRRTDLLNFGDGKYIKNMVVAKWNLATNAPDHSTAIPNI